MEGTLYIRKKYNLNKVKDNIYNSFLARVGNTDNNDDNDRAEENNDNDHAEGNNIIYNNNNADDDAEGDTCTSNTLTDVIITRNVVSDDSDTNSDDKILYKKPSTKE